ncbi:hypothetical protein [Lederbergia panacisoli]|uniref:hypothetical protein n=1 Tax=Lederbergia panacisoli TaxID=1255251 RepID=UPI00214BE0D2|nr:hypothetical protein [Lederbergia panacisoli]MCR2820440.1 hypothetical protein [Lederbergia panacisoli]
MENLLFLLIIAAISFIFKRKTGANNEQREERMPPPVARPIQTYREKAEETVRPMQQAFPELTKARTLKEAADILIANAQPAIEEKQNELKNKLEKLKIEEESHRIKAGKIKQFEQKIVQEQSVDLQFQANDILKGIVMSEVLGPPRSLRPYQRSNRS